MSTVQLRKETIAAQRAGYTVAAARYAQANRSDPFALARALTHIQMGLCDPDFDHMGNAREGFYNALLSVDPVSGRRTFTQIKRL